MLDFEKAVSFWPLKKYVKNVTTICLYYYMFINVYSLIEAFELLYYQ